MKKILLGTSAAFWVIFPGKITQAGVLHQGWQYALDSYNDGVSGTVVGPEGAFEFYSLAIREESDRLFFALNGNLPLAGEPHAFLPVNNGTVSWGDLFLNFSGQDLHTASSQGELWGIRFAASNDSGVMGLGLYNQVRGMNVSQGNAGFSSLDAYSDAVRQGGGTPTMADLAVEDSYWQQPGDWQIPNSIQMGTKVGSLSFLTQQELQQLGLDFGHFAAIGSTTVGFSVERDLLPDGSFIAHIFAECINDGIALAGELAASPEPPPPNNRQVPEPSSFWGLSFLGLGWLLQSRLRKKKS